ncbi:MAG: hypothetical protein HYX67_17610 [Candidatus Melainabacteria bacterium]|nr:hypothetical protein [Candidatus Melainabacteria bacterium]
MAFTSEEQANKALSDAVLGNPNPDIPEAPARVEPPAEPVSPPTPPEPDVSKVPKPANLPPDVQTYLDAREKEMQAVFTQRTQEAAEVRKEAESAMEFIQNLQTDPNFAVAVYNELRSALEDAGLTPEQAALEASHQVSSAVDAHVDEEEIDPIQRELNDLKSWRQEQEMRQREVEMQAYLDRSEAYIRSQNPDFQDEDVKHIVSLAYAYGGNMIQAADAYKAERDRILADYLSRKTGEPITPSLPVTGSAEIPPQGYDFNDPRLDAAAQEMLERALG